MRGEPVERVLARLAAAGVAEPSTLVIECAGEPGRTPSTLRTAMSSRVHAPAILGAAFHDSGLAEGYCTYAIEWPEAPALRAEATGSLSDHERLALGLREAVERVRSQGVPVRRFVLTGFTEACGSIDIEFAQAIADVLETRVSVRPCRDVAGRGAEVLRLLARDRSRYASVSQAIKALAEMEGREQRIWRRLDRSREIARLIGG